MKAREAMQKDASKFSSSTADTAATQRELVEDTKVYFGMLVCLSTPVYERMSVRCANESKIIVVGVLYRLKIY